MKFDFPARGGLSPVSLYWHDSATPDSPDTYKIPGLENEMVLPRPNNLGDKGRGTTGRTAGPGGPPPNRQRGVRMGAGGEGVKVYGAERQQNKAGLLTGNGAVFVGSKGMLSTIERGEGVQLLPADKWKDYKLPAQLLQRSPGHMSDWIRAAKGGEQSCSDFSIAVPFTEWVLLGVIAFRVPGKLLWDSKNFRFTNSAAANNLLKPTFRKGWELKL